MQLMDQLAALRRHWVLIAVMAVLGLLIGGGASLRTTPQYSATSVVYFSLPNSSSATDLQAGSNYAQSQVESYAQLALTPQVLNPVAKQLATPDSAKQLANALSVKVTPETVMISITATNPSPTEAAAIANAVTGSLGEQVRALSPRTTDGKASVDATVVTKAVPPTMPSSPRTKRNIIAGAFGGLLLGIVAAILREVTNTKVLGIADVQQYTEAPIIGQLGNRMGRRGSKYATDLQSPDMEGIRRLRTNLSFLGVGQRPLAVAITSAMPGEGKSTIAVKLAAALAEAGQCVLLIDGDLRRPAVGHLTNLDDAVGLSTVLINRVGFDDAVQAWEGVGADVLTAGEIPPNPSELLESQAMEDLMKEVRGRYDVIVIDTAPLVPVAETPVLAKVISGYVMVARVGVVHSRDLVEGLSTLENVGGRVFGMVLNGLSYRDSSLYGYASRSDHGPTPPSRIRGRHGHSRRRLLEQSVATKPKRSAARGVGQAARAAE